MCGDEDVTLVYGRQADAWPEQITVRSCVVNFITYKIMVFVGMKLCY